MSEQPRQLPPPPNPALLPVLVTVVYLAAVVAASGFLSLILDRDVIDYPDAGPLLGVVMAVGAGGVTWLACWRGARASGPVPAALLAGVGSFVVMVVVGAIGYTITRGELAWLILAAGHFVVSPFVIAAAVLSALAVVAAWALARASLRDAR